MSVCPLNAKVRERFHFSNLVTLLISVALDIFIFQRKDAPDRSDSLRLEVAKQLFAPWRRAVFGELSDTRAIL